MYVISVYEKKKTKNTKGNVYIVYVALQERSSMKETKIIMMLCGNASKISDNEANQNYQRNIENEINKSVMEPFCKPFSEKSRPKIHEWVPSSEIRLVYGFDFYHHSKTEAIKYAVENRGNYNQLIDDMNGLCLNEFTAPSASGKAYMVSSNGNHRRLVYSCIGLPKVSAEVQKISGNKWLFYWKGQNLNAIKLLKWLKYKGIVERIEQYPHDYSTLVISDKNHISGWIIPDPALHDLNKMICDMQDRANLLKKSFSGIDNKVSSLFKSKILLNLSIQFTFYCRNIPIFDNYEGEI